MDYTPQEFERFKGIYPDRAGDFQVREFSVNGQVLEFHTMPQHIAFEYWGKMWCGYLDKETGGCSIHQYNALSCQVELIKFFRVKDRGYIQKKPYGRGWAMKRVVDDVPEILCDFDDFSLEQFENNDLPVFRRMLGWANYLDIPTYLPDIIHHSILAVNSGYRGEIRIR